MGWVHGYYWNTRPRKPSPHENISSGNETRKAHRWVAAWRLQHLQYGCTAVDSSWSWKEYASLLPPPSERTPVSMTCWWDRQKKRGGWLMCVNSGTGRLTWALKLVCDLTEPGAHSTIPLLTSSFFTPLTSTPTWSPAWLKSRDLWNISRPAESSKIVHYTVHNYACDKQTDTHTQHIKVFHVTLSASNIQQTQKQLPFWCRRIGCNFANGQWYSYMYLEEGERGCGLIG